MDNKELEKNMSTNTPETTKVEESTIQPKEEAVVNEEVTTKNDDTVTKEANEQQEDTNETVTPEVSNVVPEVEEPSVTLNGTEQVVYEYKPPKEYGIWPFLIFFLLVGGIIVFLPNIQKFIADYKNGQIVIKGNNNSTTNNTNPGTDNNPSGEDATYYDLVENTVISINKISIDKMKKEFINGKYNLSLNITNKANSAYTYGDNVYIELYNENKTLLSRTLLESNIVIGASSSNNITILINEQAYNSATKVVVKTIKEENYPQITLAENLKDQETLTCTYGNNNIVYTFKEYKLLSIDTNLNALKNSYPDESMYAMDLASYKLKTSNYDLLNGVSATLVETIDGFTFVTKVDTSSVTESDLRSLNDRAFYKGNTEAKTINFEMNARGYTCK